ncbi:CBS domain-containing protein [Bacteroidales bacterium OttesenSCG-928-I21]|nr:CBS domain-containing protein [Bacteroidales bacterium OttesenSCG-928-I21]
MIAKDLIADSIPIVKTSDTGNQTLSLMEIHKVSHLPIVNKEEFIGLISDSDIYNNNCEGEVLANCNLSCIRPFVYEGQHIFEIIDIVAKLELSIIPVLNKKNKYLGTITLQKLIKAFSEMISVEKAGSIIILDMTIHDYSLTEIANIVESNNAKILSSYVSSSDNTTKINVTLKIDTTDITSVIQSLERFDYKIQASFLSESILKNFYTDRYDAFINYLNI